MPWCKLDDTFWSNPKVVAVGNEAAGAYARMLSYCAMQLTNGTIPEDIAKFIAKPSVISRMEQYSLIVQNGSGYVIPDYLDFNFSREEVEAKRKVRSEAGKQGGIASGKSRSKSEANASRGK